MSGPLPQREFDAIFSRVPRLTVEVVVVSAKRGVLLQLRDAGPCAGLWSLPGGTVRFGEPVVDAVKRVARDELEMTADVEEFLGYIEYPSHYDNGLDSPVGLAFRVNALDALDTPRNCEWFTVLPEKMHDEQRAFLSEPAAASAPAGIKLPPAVPNVSDDGTHAHDAGSRAAGRPIARVVTVASRRTR
jgi:ADP-ribose pyrophosphatase YjhB (NUDIX family)